MFENNSSELDVLRSQLCDFKISKSLELQKEGVILFSLLKLGWQCFLVS